MDAQPQPAECCTELGADDPHSATNGQMAVGLLLASATLMAVLVFHVAAVIL